MSIRMGQQCSKWGWRILSLVMKLAQKTRHLISNDFKEAFKKVDVIMGPVSPTTAFDLGSFKDPVSMYLADIYT
jgi:Asp-tRNA(Asn)/Glu-tRNA(Gln) amidotransferase A subunit family amidase